MSESSTPKFVHLHTHSHYSLLDGLSKIDQLVNRAKELGMPALALTDHGVMYGAIEFYQKAKKTGIKPIIGCEAYVANRSHKQKEAHIDNRRYHLTLLAKNNVGYENLIKLTTAAHLEGFYYKPRVDKALLRQHAEGLICLSGCPASELGRAIQSGDLAGAEEIVKEYQTIFGAENYYMEIMHHPDMEWYEQWKAGVVSLAKKLNIPIVATQDSHYLNKDDAFAHKTLVAISTATDVNETGIFSGAGEYHFLSTEEALEKFKDIPEAVSNTQVVAERCQVDLTLGKFIFPNFELEPGKTSDQMLDELTLTGLKDKGLDGDPEIEKRRQYELEIIKTKGYAPYFLVVSDILRFAHRSDIYTTVRGSAAGSLVAYLSGITNVNPIEFQLPFERFLNPFRPSAPDIDMDFADNRRHEILEYTKNKYGADKVAQIGTFGTMMARGSVRDVARALGKPYELGDRIAKLIPMGSQGFPMTIEQAKKIEPELKRLSEQDAEAKQILEIAEKLEGTVRHISVHAAGIVISPRPLVEYAPIQLDPKEGTHLITQYDMYTVGEDGVGLLKLDVLGIRNLAILENAVRLVEKHCDTKLDIEKIPFNDKKTFAMLARGETEGLFQLNGSGMTKHLIDLRPNTVDDINAMVALYRPGPMKNIPEYIARKNGKSPIKYFHPKAANFLEKTYGILVYQEDLLSTALELAGYTWETVDKFRKAIGKKIPAEMAKQHVIFVDGCIQHSNMPRHEAEAIWTLFEPFQGYGFGKAHAACYGRVAYQTAYMKANYPAEYMCAVLTAESGDVETVAIMIDECKRMGVPVLPPDINSSFRDFTVIKATNPGEIDQIRFGLLTIKNLGENIADTIITERESHGQYKDIEDFITRVQSRDLNKKSLESLIKCGALDSFGERNALLFNMENLLSFGKEKQKHIANGQPSLFDSPVVPIAAMGLRLQPASPAPLTERLMWEKELVGLFISGHPLKDYQEQLRTETGLVAISSLLPRPAAEVEPVFDNAEPTGNGYGHEINHETNTVKINGNGTQLRQSNVGTGTVKISGIVTKVQKIVTKTGKPMLFSWVEDLTSKIEVVVFPTILDKNPGAWVENQVLIIKGKLNDRDGVPKLLCDEVKLVSQSVTAPTISLV